MYILNNYFDFEDTTTNFEKSTETKKMEYGTNKGMTGYTTTENFGSSCGMTCPPIEECPQERVCHRYINYEVPHIIPCNTRIINHHIYRHTYTPCYTCCEENICENVFDGKCC